MAHAWKACWVQALKGSNPLSSALLFWPAGCAYRIFDLRQPDDADATLVRALQQLVKPTTPFWDLGSAILAHAAFVPGWAGHRDNGR